MKGIKFLILVVFILSLFQFNLYSLITSRVEGTVIDKDTGQPIKGVKVVLYITVSNDVTWEAITNNKGYFKFDDIRASGKYYLKCFKKGYIPFLPEYYYSKVKREYRDEVFKVFTLREGQIKHVQVKLGKGGTLKALFYKKESNGISVYKKVNFTLYRDKKPEEYYFPQYSIPMIIYTITVSTLGKIAQTEFIPPNKTGEFFIRGYHVEVTDKGEFIIFGLEPFNEYILKFKKWGYFPQIIRGINIKKNELTEFEYTFDLTNKTGIDGIITVNGLPPDDGSVRLTPQDPVVPDFHLICLNGLNKNGEYYCYGLPPGKYKMNIIIKHSNGKKMRKELIVEIIEGQTKKLNLNY